MDGLQLKVEQRSRIDHLTNTTYLAREFQPEESWPRHIDHQNDQMIDDDYLTYKH